MKYIIQLVLLSFGLIAAQAQPQICTGGDTASSDPFNKRFNCIHEWYPCGTTWWNSASGEPYSNPFTLYDQTGTYPLSPDSLRSDVCNGALLKDGWTVYDRNLETNDRYFDGFPDPLAKVASGTGTNNKGSNPFFALYNKNTGLLRTFIWVSSDTPSKDSLLLANDAIVDGQNSSPHGFGMFNNGQFSANSLGESEMKFPLTWVTVMQTMKQNSYWQVLDRYLSYEPWQTVATNSRDKKRNYQVSLWNKSADSIYLQGSMVNTTVASGGLSFFQQNPTATAIAKSGIHAISVQMSDNFTKYLKSGSSKTAVSYPSDERI